VVAVTLLWWRERGVSLRLWRRSPSTGDVS